MPDHVLITEDRLSVIMFEPRLPELMPRYDALPAGAVTGSWMQDAVDDKSLFLSVRLRPRTGKDWCIQIMDVLYLFDSWLRSSDQSAYEQWSSNGFKVVIRDSMTVDDRRHDATVIQLGDAEDDDPRHIFDTVGFADFVTGRQA
jgi:hypothetical protein